MVLTAGLGTRMYPLSAVRAKPAVPVSGIPLAGRILRWLSAAGIREAVLNLHHLPETLTAVIGDGAGSGVRVRYSWEPTLLGSAGGPARALPLLDSPRFFLINGDTLTNIDLVELARTHVASGARATMAVVPNPDPRHYNGVDVAPDGVVTGFTPRGPHNRGWHFVGVQVVDADVLAPLDPETPAETVSGCYIDLIARQPGAVRAYCRAVPFHDIGTSADYLDTCLTFADREAAVNVLLGDSVVVDPSARLDRTVVWDRVTIGANVALRECVVADDVVVPAGFTGSRQAIVRRDAMPAGAIGTIMGDLLATPLDLHRTKGPTP
jgi:NDP-sugar pyrophosphorylase family protein